MKYFLFLYISLLGNISFAQSVMHGKVDYKKVLRFNNNYFIFQQPSEIGIIYTGKQLKSAPIPFKLNGELIYNFNDVDIKPVIKKYRSLSHYIQDEISSLCESLPDGKYQMIVFNLVVNKEGELVYFDYRDIRDITNAIVFHEMANNMDEFNKILNKLKEKGNINKEIPIEVSKKISLAMYNILMNTPNFRPAKKNGLKINCLLGGSEDFTDFIIVKDHKVTFEKGFSPDKSFFN